MSLTEERVQTPAPDFDPDRAWRLHPQVALRDESFGALAYHYGTRRLLFLKSPTLVALVSALERYPSAHSGGGGRRSRSRAARHTAAPWPDWPPRRSSMPADTAALSPCASSSPTGLDAPICLTWELTYACNLACVHCLSSSGRRDPAELSPAEARGVVDELAAMKVFYVNIGGGEPMLRPDFFDLVGYAVDQKVGVKFSTNGTRMTAAKARRLAAMDYVDVQVSIDGALASTNDAVRGDGSFAAARSAMDHLAAADFGQFKISVVVTRENATQLDAFARMADELRRPAAAHPIPAVGSGRRDLGGPAPDGRSATDALSLAPRSSRGLDRRLLLPPLGSR